MERIDDEIRDLRQQVADLQKALRAITPARSGAELAIAYISCGILVLLGDYFYDAIGALIAAVSLVFSELNFLARRSAAADQRRHELITDIARLQSEIDRLDKAVLAILAAR